MAVSLPLELEGEVGGIRRLVAAVAHPEHRMLTIQE